MSSNNLPITCRLIQTKISQHNEQGYILLLCLMFITFICLLSLSMITHNEWQQRLLSMLLAHKRQEIQLDTAINAFALQKNNFTQATCIIDWKQSDEIWQALQTCTNCCVTQYKHVTFHYFVMTQALKEPAQLAILARLDTSSIWHAFTFIQPLSS